jgi:hypothetical protein
MTGPLHLESIVSLLFTERTLLALVQHSGRASHAKVVRKNSRTKLKDNINKYLGLAINSQRKSSIVAACLQITHPDQAEHYVDPFSTCILK